MVKQRSKYIKTTHRKFKVSGSFGVYDAFKAIRKSKWKGIGKPVKESDFYNIIRSINQLAAEDIANGEEFKFPEQMGSLVLKKYKCKPSIVNGKLKIPYPIDWIQTLSLWKEDAEAKRLKIFIRKEYPWFYRVKYNLYFANYTNKRFYQFCLTRSIRRVLSANIKEGKVDTIW